MSLYVSCYQPSELHLTCSSTTHWLQSCVRGSAFALGVVISALLVQAGTFWRAPYRALLNSRHLVEYMVLDIETTGQTSANGKLELADAQVRPCCCRSLFRISTFNFCFRFMPQIPSSGSPSRNMICSSNIINPFH